MTSQKIHEQAFLYAFKDQIVVVPPPLKPGDVAASNNAQRQALTIGRKNGEVSLTSIPDSSMLRSAKKKAIFGVVGMMETPHQSQIFLVVVTRKVHVGEVRGNVIWRIESVEIINLKARTAVEEAADEAAATLKSSLIRTLSTPYFYFSYTGDITMSQESLFTANEAFHSLPILKKAEARFLWNHSLLSKFSRRAAEKDMEGIYDFVLPLIHGAVFVNKCSINGKTFKWSLISRRSCRRVGARMWLRGCDRQGNVANFVETEQIVEDGDMKALSSFIQTRGSMPMFWNQKPDLRYKPPPKMIMDADHVTGFLNHFKEQLKLYNEQVIVNLINQQGAEGELEVSLKNFVREANVSGLTYVGYDFHAECKGGDWSKLSMLIDKLRGSLNSFEYFFISGSDATTLKTQKGVFRTNCIDCLDRTNVVQSLLATENLSIVLKRMRILNPTDNILKQRDFQEICRNIWADHADIISVQYAGTGALKTDFTRTGKRTKMGLLQDGWNALTRYFLNNFMDGDRTDALRVFVNECEPMQYVRSRANHLNNNQLGPLAYCPLFLLLPLTVFAYTIVFSKADSQSATIIVGCIVMLGCIGILLKQNGKHFVNLPVTLLKLE